MDSGLSTIIGALVGGGGTLAGTALTQQRQHTRESSRRKDEVTERARTAARIVLGDLAWDRSRVNQAIKNGKYWSERYELISESWEQYRETLALCIASAEDWWTVHDAFRSVRAFRLHAVKQRGDKPLAQAQFDAWATREAKRCLERVDAAIAVLEPVAGRTVTEEAEREDS
jgi:hypothetical protein